jgi:hypothetical protein
VPLILKRNEASPDPDRFVVYSGKAVVSHADARPERREAGLMALVHHRLSRLADRSWSERRHVAKPGGSHVGLGEALASLAGLGGAEGDRTRGAGGAALRPPRPLATRLRRLDKNCFPATPREFLVSTESEV